MSSSQPETSVGEGSNPETAPKEISLNDRFFRYFQQEIIALQEQMDRLAGLSMVGGERKDAVDHCLAGISRLSSEVKDASSYIPTYDQRIYGEAIKALQEKLAETREKIAPRQKFTFKTARKNPSAVSLADAAELAAQDRRHIPGYRSTQNSSPDSSSNPTPPRTDSPVNGGLAVSKQGILPHKGPTSAPNANTPPSSETSPVSINSHSGRHIVLPTSASHATVPASIVSLRHCAVDMSIPTSNGRPFAGLSVKEISESLLICGQVNGAAHITGVKHSVIVVSCHQFRMHDCKDVDVYLSCSSKPIIEDCSNIRFGKIPKYYASELPNGSSTDLWSQVEDFKWLKSEPSPNWRILKESEAIVDDVWVEICAGIPGRSLDDILKATKVMASPNSA